MSCLPVDTRGCGLVLRTAEPQRSLLGSLGKLGGRQEEGRWLGSFCHSRSLSWTRPLLAPHHRGPGAGPSVSACPRGDLLRLSPSSLYFLLSLLSVSIRCSASPHLPPASASLAHELVSRSLRFFSVLLPGLPSRAFFLPVLPPSFMTRLCSPLPAAFSQVTKSSMSQKRKKGKKNQNTKKPNKNKS